MVRVRAAVVGFAVGLAVVLAAEFVVGAVEVLGVAADVDPLEA